MSTRLPRLYVVTRHGRIATAQLQRERRGEHVYLYLQWKDGPRPRKVYLGARA